MPGDQHHRSKKVRYDLLWVPRDDAGRPRSVRFAPWQFVALIAGSVVLVVAVVITLLYTTPLGPTLNIPNPELENRYAKEVLSLNQRVAAVLEQLVELREYNVRLRRALGENVVATDSGVKVVASARPSGPERQLGGDQSARQTRLVDGDRSVPQIGVRSGAGPRPTELSTISAGASGSGADRHDRSPVVFPAVMPAEGYLTRGFDPEQRHYGLDIAGKAGSLVNAAADGHVVFSGWTSEDGYKVILAHTGGFLTFYKHNQSLLKEVNSFVRRGEPIALLGSSGQTSFGPHVHFEIWKDGVPVDPARYILNLNF